MILLALLAAPVADEKLLSFGGGCRIDKNTVWQVIKRAEAA